MDAVDEFLSQVYQCSLLPYNQQGIELTKLLTPDISTNPYIVKINRVPNIEDDAINKLVDNRHFYNDEWLAFNEMVVCFIRLCNRIDPWSLLNSFDWYIEYINSISVAFNNAERGYLVSYIARDTVAIILPMASKLDKQLYLRENCTRPRLTYLASILLKIFNNIRSQVSGDIPDNSLKYNMKSSILLRIGVKLCHIYFKLLNPLLCRNIFSNMSNANLSMARYSMNERLQYRYYLGRFYLIKNEFLDAYRHLLWCLTHCPPAKDHPNVSRILKFLLPVSIIIGKTPNYRHIAAVYYSSPSAAPSFLTLYQSVTQAILQGNHTAFHSILSSPHYHKFLKLSNLLLPLTSKGPLLILRNLLKRIWVLSARPTKLHYEEIAIALSLSIDTSAYAYDIYSIVSDLSDLAIIENILISLIDQNLLKGKLFPRLRVISLAKSNVFPNVDEINFLKFGGGKEGTINRNDTWLDS